MPRSLIRLLLIFLICLALLITVSITRTITSSHAASATSNGLSVSVGYAEIKGKNKPNPTAFPVPWSGAPNTIFLGGRVTGQSACGTNPLCYDAGAIRLDNSGSSDITIDKVVVDVHSSISGGKVYKLWGSFTVPAGKSVILTENPPGNNPNYDNFDTSGTPKGNCTPIAVAPTVTITIGGVPTTLVDSTHVIDTGGIDPDSCNHPNESTQWRQIGTSGVKKASVMLSPATTTQLVGQQVTETAFLQDGSGNGLPNAAVTFTVTSGPDAGQSRSTFTDQTGHASFTYTSSAPGTDSVVATVTSAGTFQSNSASVLWTNASTTS